MIRTVLFSNVLASIMSDGASTCENAMNAINMYFEEHVYRNSSGRVPHPRAIDENIINIVKTAIVQDDPHLKDMFTVSLLRDTPDSMVADLEVLMDAVYLNLLKSQPGVYKWH